MQGIQRRANCGLLRTKYVNQRPNHGRVKLSGGRQQSGMLLQSDQRGNLQCIRLVVGQKLQQNLPRRRVRHRGNGLQPLTPHFALVQLSEDQQCVVAARRMEFARS